MTKEWGLDPILHYDIREGLEPKAPLGRGLAIGTES